MKNLANCKPSEFLRQTNLIRKAVSKWLTDTDIASIRRRMPDIPDTATDEEKQEAIQKQARENFGVIMDVILDEYPDETLELLALMCFVEPDHVDDYPISDYMESVTELMQNQAVISFFISLTNWVNRLT